MLRTSGPLVVLWLSSLAACVEPASITCPSGLVCPARSICEADRCLRSEQFDACATVADLEECLVFGLSGTCLGGICEVASCGNSSVELGEVCDDGNRQDADGCRSDCQSNESCGNGIIDFVVGEQCDCGDGTLAAPGCTMANGDAGGVCRTDCRLHCGDGVLATDEVCDGRPRPFETCMLWEYDLGALGCEQCGLDFSSCRQIGWQEVVEGFDLKAIWGSAADNMFAVGARAAVMGGDDSGVVLHFDGIAWTFASFPTPFVDIDGRGPDDVFAVATPPSGSQIWHHDGTTWTLTPWPSAVAQTMRAVWSRGGGGAIAVGELGQIYEYDGVAWTRMTTTELTGAPLEDVWGAAANDVWAVGGSTTVGGVVAHFTGSAWSSVTIPALAGVSFVRAIEGISANDILIGGGDKLVRGSASGWVDISPPGLTDLRGIWARNASDIFVIDGSGRVMRLRGTRWIEQMTPPADARGIWGMANHVYGAHAGGLREYTELAWRIPPPAPPDSLSASGLSTAGPDDFYTTSQNGSMGYDVLHWDGQSWSADSFSEPLRDVWAAGGDIVAVGDDGTIVQGTGFPLSPATSNTTAHLLAVAGANASDVVAVGAAGAIVEYQGTAWAPATSPTSSTLRAVWVGAGLAVAVGAQGTIVHRTGTTWTGMASPTSVELVSVWGLGPDLVYAVGSDGTLLRYDGTAWTIEPALFGVIGLTAIAGTGPDDIFAVGDRTLLHRDANGWAPVRLPMAVVWIAIAVQPGSVIMLGQHGEIGWLDRE